MKEREELVHVVINDTYGVQVMQIYTFGMCVCVRACVCACVCACMCVLVFY